MTCRMCDKLEPRGCGNTCCAVDKHVIMSFDDECFGTCEYAFEKDYVHIFNLFVNINKRGNGLSKKLLQYTIDKIRKSGYCGDILIVANSKEDGIDNNRLKKLYESFGLKVFDNYS